MSRFHGRWADGDEIYKGFVICYAKWKKFNTEPAKQSQVGRRRYAHDDNLRGIFGEGLLRHGQKVRLLEGEFRRLQSRRVVGVRSVRSKHVSEGENGNGQESEFECPFSERVEITENLCYFANAVQDVN